MISWLISKIRKASESVREINKIVLEIKPVFQQNLCKAVNSISSVTCGVEKAVNFLNKQKNTLLGKIVKYAIILLLVVFLKIPKKKIAAIIDLFLTTASILTA